MDEVQEGRYVVARWRDGRGANTVAGKVTKVEPLTVLSLYGSGYVQIPSSAQLSVPVGPNQPPRVIRKGGTR